MIIAQRLLYRFERDIFIKDKKNNNCNNEKKWNKLSH